MLETDRANLAAFCESCVTLAATRYRARIVDGEPRESAYAESLAYLRRKTQWGAVIAAAALDAELATVPIVREQPKHV